MRVLSKVTSLLPQGASSPSSGEGNGPVEGREGHGWHFVLNDYVFCPL